MADPERDRDRDRDSDQEPEPDSDPEPSRAAVLRFLQERGGRARSAELRGRFKPQLEAGEAGERAARRARFTALVNSLAVVQELDGAKFVVLRKKLRARPEGEPGGAPEEGAREPVAQLRGLFQSQAGGVPVPVAPKKEAPSKPCMLPVRCLAPAPQEAAGLPPAGSPRSPLARRRQGEEAGGRSPHPRRAAKAQKVSEEAGEAVAVPLEDTEHQWLVKAAGGQWSQQLHGLLLRDATLAGRRDFMCGFTALHWAAKSGNCDMVEKVIEVARRGGADVDVNAKSHGGYTALHVAAMHGREEVIATLVKTYDAKVNLRDYSGKKPHHYLREGSSYAVRHLLGDPELHNTVGHSVPSKKNAKIAASILSSTSTFLGVLSDDTAFYDLTKGLKKTYSLNKFLGASTGTRKKPRSRATFPSYSSLSEAVEEEQEQEEATVKPRPVSELFFSH